MSLKSIILLIFTLFIFGCEQLPKSQSKLNLELQERYRNSGFALIYENDIKKIKKIDDRSLLIHHKFLKRNSAVKITNPKNGKSIIAKVLSNRQQFSDFYNSIISKRIAEGLELDFKEPYIEIILVSKNSTFISRK